VPDEYVTDAELESAAVRQRVLTGQGFQNLLKASLQCRPPRHSLQIPVRPGKSARSGWRATGRRKSGRLVQKEKPSVNLWKFPTLTVPQRWIVAELDALQAEVDALKRLQAETAAELDALLPAILDRAFKREV
jgi:hypothetical protein